MEYVNFYERIYNIKNLKIVSEKICEYYNLGDLVEYKHIDIGYEDFNMLLKTSNGKYFVKILNKSRPKAEQERLIKILKKSIDNEVKVPKLYDVNGRNIFQLKIDNKILNIIVMDYIDGTNMLLLERDFTETEIINIAREMAKINSIDYNVEPYYDEWTITHFESEYNKKSNNIDIEDRLLVTNIYNQMKKIDFKKFKMAYIHGDIIKSNLILDKNGNVWVIDFSVLNYLPRVIELAVAMFGICMTDDRDKTISNINSLLGEYNKINKLDKYEIQNLPLIFNCISAMNILQTAYIKNTDETFEENEHWLSEGRKGLSLNLTIQDLKL